ncbi:hypothetical protein [Zunongwangia atlantica]|uniref:Uncharacterized protein n=1 Tax=Zunongwangia atlantica 22II14-10F7 TaxID=1185767 RepID=A0A1Y1SYD6_9FLAO|nr:hypothetical protein [Zunongwangia atlantica]ORL43769.1 hypothetical protein IIF7_18994 [Zunongwangia atlantica 22II14-10F7]
MLALQTESLSKFSEYGLPGLIILTLIIAVGYLFKVVHDYSKSDRQRADHFGEAFMTISKDQNETNRKIVDVTEKIAEQNKNYHDDTTRRLEEMPEKIIKEFEYRQLRQVQQNNTTPAP